MMEAVTDLLCKSMDWFLYDKDPRHERVKKGTFKKYAKYM